MRPFTADDLPRLHAIREAAFAPIFHSFREIVGPDIAATVLADAEAEQAALLDAMCAPGSEWSVSVVLLAEEIAGFVSTKLDAASGVGEIGLNAVHPDHAGRGIGSWMYREALAELTRRGARVATVGTGGDPAHAPARRAYEKADFGVSIPSIYAYKLL
jgi:ribosomal protein S18 acetylase RimI-like enzyme